MSEQAVAEPPTQTPVAADHTPSRRKLAVGSRELRVTVPVLLVAVSTAFVFATGMRPGYDAYGWLVWGHQTLHWDLDTNGAPSWKPLTFLFTLPFSLAGRGGVWLWMIASVAGAFAGVWFAASIAYRLTAPGVRRPWAPLAAAVFAGVGMLGLAGYWQQTLIANSDQLTASLCLAAIDCHLAKRYRLAFILVVLAALGRPEAWPFAGLYAVWSWRAVPSMRPLALAGIAAIPLLWFGIPALTAKSWFRGGDLALNSVNAIHGNKVLGVISRFRALNETPLQIAALCAVVLAVIRRDRNTLLVTGAAVLWVGVEIAFALHGWSAVERYLFAPGAVIVVLAAVTVGRLMSSGPLPRALRWAGPVAVLAFLAVLMPTAHHHERIVRRLILEAHTSARLVNRLPALIERLGGDERIKSCGQPVTFVGEQSTVAYYLEMNVGNVGYKPGREIQTGKPIVIFRPSGLGWSVQPVHIRPRDRARCASLNADTDRR